MRISTTFVLACTVLLFAVPVSADPSTTSRLSWVTNGDVQAAVQVGNTLYIGGTFTRVAPASGALGSFFGVSTITGDSLPLFPLVDGIVHAVEPDGAGGYYIGGAFTRVGGVARTNLAHVLPGGGVDPNFAPTLSGGPVRALALGSSSLFVGGSFTNVNGTTRVGFALLDPATAATIVLPPPAFADVISPIRILIAATNVITLTSGSTNVPPRVFAFNQTTGAAVWSATLTGTANDAVIAGTRLILGGRRLQADNRSLVSLDLATGAIDSAWIPSGPQQDTSADAVDALAVFGTTLYVGGTFSTFGSQPRANAAAVDIPLGTATPWAPNPNGAITALVTTLAGTILLSGTFTEVDGEPRDTFAEVDGNGNSTALITDVQAALVRTMRVDVAGNVVVGGLAGVTDAPPRTNLAAFDLSTNTLLPWAPAIGDPVTALGAVGNRIFVGASQLVSGPSPSTRGVVSAFDGISGAPVAWAPPASSTDVTLVGTHGPHVYVGGSFAVGSFLRLDAVMAAIDPGWRPLVGRPSHMVVSGTVMYLGAGSGLASVDVASGARSTWAPSLLGGFPFANVTINGLAVDGRTVYVSYRHATIMGTVSHPVFAFDAISGLRTGPLSFGPGSGTPDALAVADGQVIVARLPEAGFLTEPVARVQAFDTRGQATSWDPRYLRVDSPRRFAKPGFLVTATDVIVLGYHGATPVPVQGIAVLPRTPSAAPATLRASTIGNLVNLIWDAPTTPPAAEYVVDVAATPGSSSPLSLPTGRSTPGISGVAGNGTYYARVRASGAPAGPASLPTNEIAIVVGCSAAPIAAPSNLAAQVNGSSVTLSWNLPPFPTATRYLLEVGSAAGAADIGTFTMSPLQVNIAGIAPAGTYFARIRAANDCGQSAPSSEVFLTVGSPATIPAAPTALSASVVGSNVSLQWNASPGASAYVLEVGSAPGQSNFGTLPVSTTTLAAAGVPNGVYHVRVRALNEAGLSAPSSDVVVVVSQ